MSEIIMEQNTLTYFETDKELYVQQSAFDASPEVEKSWDIYALRKNGIAAEPSVKIKVFMGGFVDILVYEAVPAFMLNYIVEKHKNVSVFAKFEKTARKEETELSKKHPSSFVFTEDLVQNFIEDKSYHKLVEFDGGDVVYADGKIVPYMEYVESLRGRTR